MVMGELLFLVELVVVRGQQLLQVVEYSQTIWDYGSLRLDKQVLTDPL
jgi:hypothetical protein